MKKDLSDEELFENIRRKSKMKFNRFNEENNNLG